MKSIKAEAKSSHATKLHALGGRGSPGKSLDIAPGHTWNGEAGLTSDDKVNQAQRIPTRKHGGRVEGEKAKPRMDRTPRASGGRVGKGKTNITIVVGAPQGGQQQPPAPPQRVPVPVPVPQPAAPPMGGGAPGMGMPPGAPPMGGAMPPPMMRKKGGRVMMHAGAGGGEGRLEKIEIQKRSGK